MGKRKGFISIIALIIMSVLLTMVLYLGYISKLEYLILNVNNYKTQAYYQSEGKIHLALYDERYYLDQLYPNILDVFRTNNFSTLSKRVIIDDLDLEFGDDIEKVMLGFLDKNDRIEMNIMADSNNNGVRSKLTSSGTIVSKIFETEYPVLSPNLVDEKYKEELGKLLVSIGKDISIYNCNKPETMFGMESTNFSKITLKKRDNDNYEISSIRETMISPYVERFNKEEVFIIARNHRGEKLNFFIGNPDNPSKTIKLSGVIFVEGNIIISDNLQLKGIIIVKNGEIIINSINKPYIEGLIIMDNMKDYDDFIKKIDIIRVRHIIYKYGTYIPGFLDPKLTVIKGI